MWFASKEEQIDGARVLGIVGRGGRGMCGRARLGDDQGLVGGSEDLGWVDEGLACKMAANDFPFGQGSMWIG